MSSIPDNIKTLLDKHGLYNKDAAWELPQKKGTWILKHKTLEALAVAEKIQFSEPKIHFNGDAVIVWVQGVRGDLTEWSYGEACPKTSMNKYYVAMSEKRAKDRVILKLLGLHGDAYSEEEADDFKQPTNDYGFSNKAREKEYHIMLNIITDIWTPTVCDLATLKPMFDIAGKVSPDHKRAKDADYAKLEQLEKDFEKDAEFTV